MNSFIFVSSHKMKKSPSITINEINLRASFLKQRSILYNFFKTVWATTNLLGQVTWVVLQVTWPARLVVDNTVKIIKYKKWKEMQILYLQTTIYVLRCNLLKRLTKLRVRFVFGQISRLLLLIWKKLICNSKMELNPPKCNASIWLRKRW